MKKRGKPAAPRKHSRKLKVVGAGAQTSWKTVWNAVFLLVILSGVGATAWLLVKRSTVSTQYHARPSGTLTFNKDVAPILFEHCAECHRTGQSAPFSLLDYADVKKHAREMAKVITKRYMPPWPPEPGFGEFANARRLSIGQIGTIRQWTAEGAVEGAPSDRPAPPRWAEGWRLGEPDLVLRMPEPYTLAAGGKDIYRNFVIPIPTSGTRYVEAAEFLPDNPKIVHHAFMKIDRTRESRRLDEKDPEPGFSFMITPDSAQMSDGHFLNWTPGSRPSRESKGLAWTLHEGSDLVLQAHLNSSGKPEVIQSSVGLYFTDVPPTNSPFKILLTSRAIDIPAATKNYVVQDAFVLPVDVEVLAILPHAHYLGNELEAYATLPGGKKKWLLRIRDWNFNWQEAYRYAAPFFLPKGTTLSMHFTYDNSTGNVRNPNHPPRRVMYGPQTTDEMAELWLQVLAWNRDDRETLAKDFQSKMQNTGIP